MENSMKIPQKIGNQTTILSSNPITWYISKKVEISMPKVSFEKIIFFNKQDERLKSMKQSR